MIPTTWTDIKYRHDLATLWAKIMSVRRGVMKYAIPPFVYLGVLIAPERVPNYLGNRAEQKLEELEAEHGLE